MYLEKCILSFHLNQVVCFSLQKFMSFQDCRKLIFIWAFCLFFTACGTTPNPQERTLLIYTPHGKDMLTDLVERYKKVNPEVDVQFVDMGAREVLERLRAEKNRPQADLWFGAAHTTFQNAADENLLAPYRPTWADKVPTESHEANNLWFATYETPEVIAYNSDVLKSEEAPGDWNDILDEKWRDKVLIRNPIPSDSMRVIFGAMMMREGSNEKGFEWLKKLDKNVKEYTADGTLLMQKITRQEGIVTLWNMPDAVLYKEQKGMPIAYKFPTSGTPVVLDGIAIVKGAPHEEEAKKFYEFVTTEENLYFTAQKYYRLPVRKDLEKTKLPAWMNEDFKRLPMDWNKFRQESNDWMRTWDTEIRGRMRSSRS